MIEKKKKFNASAVSLCLNNDTFQRNYDKKKGNYSLKNKRNAIINKNFCMKVTVPRK